MFTDLFGPRGLVVDSLATLPGEQSHSAHFNSDFQFNFSQFSTALVSQLVSAPLPSPASGFTYEFDTSLGVFRRDRLEETDAIIPDLDRLTHLVTHAAYGALPITSLDV